MGAPGWLGMHIELPGRRPWPGGHCTPGVGSGMPGVVLPGTPGVEVPGICGVGLPGTVGMVVPGRLGAVVHGMPGVLEPVPGIGMPGEPVPVPGVCAAAGASTCAEAHDAHHLAVLDHGQAAPHGDRACPVPGASASRFERGAAGSHSVAAVRQGRSAGCELPSTAPGSIPWSARRPSRRRRAGAAGIGLLSNGYGQDALERAGACRVHQDSAAMLRHLDEVGVR